jgi:hypothetical protein
VIAVTVLFSKVLRCQRTSEVDKINACELARGKVTYFIDMQRRLLIGACLLFVLSVLPRTFAGMILGGSHSTPVTAESQKIAEVAVQQLNGKANFPKKGTLKLEKVISAKTQVINSAYCTM